MPKRDARRLLSSDERFQQWVQWIERVDHELRYLKLNSRMFNSMKQVFRYNPHLQRVGKRMFQWCLHNYAAGAAMSLRRELDRAKSDAFIHLLWEIHEHPEVLSRERFYKQWGPLRPERNAALRRRIFELVDLTRHPTDEMRDHIDPSYVQEHITKLGRDTETVHNFIEQTIAHRSPSRPPGISFAQVDKAVQALMRVHDTYYGRLTLKSGGAEEFTLDSDIDVFTFPWDVTCYRLWEQYRDGQDAPRQEMSAVYSGLPPVAR